LCGWMTLQVEVIFPLPTPVSKSNTPGTLFFMPPLGFELHCFRCFLPLVFWVGYLVFICSAPTIIFVLLPDWSFDCAFLRETPGAYPRFCLHASCFPLKLCLFPELYPFRPRLSHLLFALFLDRDRLLPPPFPGPLV